MSRKRNHNQAKIEARRKRAPVTEQRFRARSTKGFSNYEAARAFKVPANVHRTRIRRRSGGTFEVVIYEPVTPKESIG